MRFLSPIGGVTLSMDKLRDFELRRAILDMRRVDAGISLNDYAGPLVHHRSFSRILGLTSTAWSIEREKDILTTGQAEAYKRADLSERVMSTSDAIIPDLDIIVIDEITGDSKAVGIAPALDSLGDPLSSSPSVDCKYVSYLDNDPLQDEAGSTKGP